MITWEFKNALLSIMPEKKHLWPVCSKNKLPLKAVVLIAGNNRALAELTIATHLCFAYLFQPMQLWSSLQQTWISTRTTI